MSGWMYAVAGRALQQGVPPQQYYQQLRAGGAMPPPTTTLAGGQTIGGDQFNLRYPAYPPEQLGSLRLEHLQELAMNLWDALLPNVNLEDVPLGEDSLVPWVAEAQRKALGLRDEVPADFGDVSGPLPLLGGPRYAPGDSNNCAAEKARGDKRTGSARQQAGHGVWWPPASWASDDESEPTKKQRSDDCLLLPLPFPANVEEALEAKFKMEKKACAIAVGVLLEAGRVPAGVRDKLLSPAPEGFGVLATAGRPDVARLRLPTEACSFTSPGTTASGTTAAGTSWIYDFRKGVNTFAQEYRLGGLKFTEAWTGPSSLPPSHRGMVFPIGAWTGPSSHRATEAWSRTAWDDDGRLLVSLTGRQVKKGNMEALLARLRLVECVENVPYEDLLLALPIKMSHCDLVAVASAVVGA